MSRIVCQFLLVFACWMWACQGNSRAPEINVSGAWSRPVIVAPAAVGPDTNAAATSPSPFNGVVYLRIENQGGVADRLLRASADICAFTEIHQTIMQGDRMSMRKSENGLAVPARGSLELSPGGHHIMLIGLKRTLRVGDRFELRLEFEKSGVQSVFSEVHE